MSNGILSSSSTGRVPSTKISFEAVAAAQQLGAALGQAVTAVVLGADASLAREVTGYRVGARRLGREPEARRLHARRLRRRDRAGRARARPAVRHLAAHLPRARLRAEARRALRQGADQRLHPREGRGRQGHVHAPHLSRQDGRRRDGRAARRPSSRPSSRARTAATRPSAATQRRRSSRCPSRSARCG